MQILDDISQGLKKGAEKARNAFNTLEIQQAINKIEGAIKDKKLAVGDIVFGLHKDKKLNISELETICTEIDTLVAQMEENN